MNGLDYLDELIRMKNVLCTNVYGCAMLTVATTP